MGRKLRKQRVALRFRRREQIKIHLRTVLVRTSILALVVGFGFGISAGPNSAVATFLRNHTPTVQLAIPTPLTGVPAASELPAQKVWLWVPGSGIYVNQQVTRKYPAVRKVTINRAWRKNEVTVRLEPRVPLVLWNGRGFDRDGVQFSVMPEAWKTMPQAQYQTQFSAQDLGRWTSQLASNYLLWMKIQTIKQDAYGIVELTLKSGTSVIWGLPEKELAARKAQALLRVLDDMHTHSGGSARADLRFFDQGRIIVMPKLSK